MIDIEDVERRRLAGESLRSIARALGVTHQTLQYHRKRAGYEPLRSSVSGADHASWRGGRFTDRFGYTMVMSPDSGRANKYVPEHVLVAEAELGRRLLPSEVVHHVNGRKWDNRPANLYVCTRAMHVAIHQMLEQVALDFLDRGLVKFEDGTYRAT